MTEWRANSGRTASVMLLCAGLGMAAATTAGAESASPMQFWLEQPPQVASEGRAHSAPAFRPTRRTDNARAERRSLSTMRASDPAAFVTAVFGDSFASDAARGLADLDPAGRSEAVLDWSGDDTSLTGATLPITGDSLAAATKQAGRMDAAVVMLGAGDLRPILDEHKQIVAPDSPAWRTIYAERVRQVIALFRDRKVPLIWVGLPVVRDDDLAARFAGLNAIVRENTAAANVPFVDAWAAFADENGHYATSGPDEVGQTAKLRREDGRRFTRAGARKLASFIDAQLKPLLDKAAASAKLASLGATNADVFDQALSIDINAQIRREAGLPSPVDGGEDKDGTVVELTAAPLAVEGRLASAQTPLALGTRAEAVLVSGLSPPARPGRVDDFSWPKP